MKRIKKTARRKQLAPPQSRVVYVQYCVKVPIEVGLALDRILEARTTGISPTIAALIMEEQDRLLPEEGS